MKTYRNKHFTKRNYETTNVVACQAEKNPDPAKWVEADESILVGLTPLWTERGVKLFGHM